MAYVTQTDIERAAGGSGRLVDLTDNDGDGSVDATLLSETINDVERFVDSYIEPRHSVPLDEPVPDIVRRVVAQEVVYILRGYRQAIDDRTQEQHETNLEWLRDVASGRVGLGLTPAAKDRTAASAEAGDRSDVTGAVTREDLEGFW